LKSIAGMPSASLRELSKGKVPDDNKPFWFMSKTQFNRAAKPNDPQRDWRKLQGQWQGNWNPCGSNSGDNHAVGVPKKISNENIQAVNTG